jgi:hypothetical protein
MQMQAVKLEVLIVDHDGIGAEAIKEVIENARYPNRCIMPSVMTVEARDIGEWVDNNPLNNSTTAHAEFVRLFGAK